MKIVRQGKTVNDAIDFYAGIYAQDQGLAHRSKKSIRYSSKPLYKFFKDKFVRDVTETEIINYKIFRGKKVSNSTIARELSILRTSLNMAIEHGIINSHSEVEHIKNLKIKLPKQKKRGAEFIPTIEQAEQIIELLYEPWKSLAFAAHRLAWRETELIEMRFGWIDFENKLLRLPERFSKNGIALNSPLYKEIYDFLFTKFEQAQKEYARLNVNDVYVFRKNGKKLNNNNIYYPWHQTLNRLRFPNFHFHDLRKAAISYLEIKYGMSGEMIRTLYTNQSKEVFDGWYNLVTQEKTNHWTKQILQM